jgi:hypothetical protein
LNCWYGELLLQTSHVTLHVGLQSKHARVDRQHEPSAAVMGERGVVDGGSNAWRNALLVCVCVCV